MRPTRNRSLDLTVVMAFALGLVAVAPPASGTAAARLADALAAPAGTEVHLPGGNYQGAKDTLQREDRLVIVCDATCAVDGGIKFERSSNVTLRGHFVFNGNVRMASATDITLDGVEITNSRTREAKGVAINNYTKGYPPSSNIVVRNSWIHDTNDDSFNISRADNVLLENNRAERAQDLAGVSCSGKKCHSDVLQVMGESTGIVVRDNDFSGNVIAKTDFGSIDLVFERNKVHDGRNWGITLFREPDTELVVRLASSYVWGHKYGAIYQKGSPTVTLVDMVYDAPPVEAELDGEELFEEGLDDFDMLLGDLN